MDFDLAPYLEPFNLTPKQVQRIARLLKSRLRWWGLDNADLALRVAIIAAPGQLAKLTPEAIELLRRCRNRVQAFRNGPDDRFGISRRTFGQLFRQLLKLDLIVESDARQKLSGSKNVAQLRALLQERGLPTVGNRCEVRSIPTQRVAISWYHWKGCSTRHLAISCFHRTE